MLSLSMFYGCANKDNESQTNNYPKGGSIILSTTTSTENSGLLDAILSDFRKRQE